MVKKKKAVSTPAKGDNMSVSGDLYKTIVSIVDDRMEGNKVVRSGFDSLAASIRELTEAQKKTEGRIDSLAVSIRELAESQKKTDATMKELAESQKRTDAKFEVMVETMQQTHLEIRDLNRRVGGISNSIGYALENEVYRSLPKLLSARYGIKMDEKFLRKHVKYADGSSGEINIYGTGKLNGKAIAVIGEVKTRLEKGDIDEIKEKSEKLRPTVPQEHFLVTATHFCVQEVIDYAAKNDVAVVMTYEFI